MMTGELARSASEIVHAALTRPMWLKVHGKLLPTASANHTTRLWNLGFTSWPHRDARSSTAICP